MLKTTFIINSIVDSFFKRKEKKECKNIKEIDQQEMSITFINRLNIMEINLKKLLHAPILLSIIYKENTLYTTMYKEVKRKCITFLELSHLYKKRLYTPQYLISKDFNVLIKHDIKIEDLESSIGHLYTEIFLDITATK